MNAVGWWLEWGLNPNHACDKRKPFVLTNASSSIPADTPRPLWRRRVMLYCVIGWTTFVGLALWWWLRSHAVPAVWIVERTNPSSGAETFRASFSSGMGFQRIFPWLLFGPYVALVAFFFPVERDWLRLNVPLNLAMCAAFLVACHAVNVGTRMMFGHATIVRSTGLSTGSQTNQEEVISTAGLTNLFVQMRQGFQSPLPSPRPPDVTLWSWLFDLLAYGAITGLAHSVHFYRRFRERERRALLLETNLANARLDALRAQLQPHFLFNSLNAVAALLRRDAHQAEATLLSLSDLLRLVLSRSEKPEISLREEMEFVQRYVEIQQTRFCDKLRVEQELAPAALNCLVPTLLLQPLIENAIRHGIEPAENAGLVRLTAQRRDGKLILTVEDDGVGLAGRDAASGGTGIGLANLRARLEALYGAAQNLELLPRPEGGLIVRVEIPGRSMTASKSPGALNPS